MESVNTQLVQQWITALRTDKYRQGRSQLRTQKSEYCCLGVLCDVHYGSNAWTTNAGGFYKIEGSDVSLPLPLADLLGQGRSDPRVYIAKHSKLDDRVSDPIHMPFSHYYYLSQLNDNFNFTFADIADILEQAIDPDNENVYFA